MIWQDLVFGIGSFIFSIALVPSIIGKDKPAIGTSLSTALVLTTFVIAYITLSFWLAVIAISMTMMAWYILAFQKYLQTKQK